MKSLAPLFRMYRITWARFLVRTCDPLAPHFGGLVIKLNELERD